MDVIDNKFINTLITHTNGTFNYQSDVATEAWGKYAGLGDDKDGGPRT